MTINQKFLRKIKSMYMTSECHSNAINLTKLCINIFLFFFQNKIYFHRKYNEFLESFVHIFKEIKSPCNLFPI